MTLAEYLASEPDVNLTSFAKAMGVLPSVAHDWKSGRRFPRGRAIAEIERLTGGKVKASDFLSQAAE